MLAHADIVVGAPNGDVRAWLHVCLMVQRVRESTGAARQVGEHAIAPLGLEARYRLSKITLIIHGLPANSAVVAGRNLTGIEWRRQGSSIRPLSERDR